MEEIFGCADMFFCNPTFAPHSHTNNNKMSYLFFFGYEALPGTPGKTIPPEGTVLHISQLTLAPGAKDGEVIRVFVQTSEDIEDDSEEEEQEQEEEEQDNKKFCIGVLVGGKKESLHLDLNFQGEAVTFFVEGGNVPVHVTGYYNVLEFDDEDGEFDEDGDEEAYLRALQAGSDDEDGSDDENSGVKIEELGQDDDSEDEVPVKKIVPKKAQPAVAPKKEQQQGQKRKADEAQPAAAPAAKKQKTEAQPAAAPQKQQQQPKQQQQQQPKQQKQGGQQQGGQGKKKNKKNQQ